MAEFLCTLFLTLFLTILGISKAAPDNALITHLPGFSGTLPSKHYAGYVSIDKNHGKNLFYYFVVSERNPSKDPVVLWLNGGPGCSSFDGFVYEHGPFNFQAARKPKTLPQLHLNPYSWSKVSSIIYLDSPVGVGFSYSNNSEDYSTNDTKTASDTHTFLLKWFEQYPEFRANPFYLSGESFAGVYVPTLASEVVKGIEAGLKPILNFKGYMVGNGVTDQIFDGDALVPFAHGMGLISDDLFQEVNSACEGSYWNPASDRCEKKLDQVDEDIGSVNIYNILEPCYHSPKPRGIAADKGRLPTSFSQLGETERPLAVRKRMFGRSWPLGASVRDGRVPTWPELGRTVPCTNDEVATSWLNNEKVRNAIHAPQANVSGTWELCTGRIEYDHDAGSMIRHHRDLTTRGYRVLIFSGDHDMCVPFTGSEAWTRSLGYRIIDEWRPWFFKEQVAGYTQGYANNLTFLTVKGCGHTVPEYKPKEALAFYSHWLAGERI
ncbi:serine carboxypeptidase 1-like isoform X2 [Tasmannia lanceolata]|uniref:serine carboxypeptidase 1-like isoform X2 n=1 Tax=Tasmannia lanceolata TaxID=3420 RepID=UPI004063CF32